MCGLKQSYVRVSFHEDESHPSWVCGLKQYKRTIHILLRKSHPSWVCGLKLRDSNVHAITLTESHPSWVCGLKLRDRTKSLLSKEVTPFVGVWIETYPHTSISNHGKSHPSWVCGLKHLLIFLLLDQSRHTLRGCVD